ncbi:cell division cycle-associated protein 2 isoform X2 [Entelurus aequoreus]|uniref:cell division cycle-associated protein 2 isoform X2 n=1 Tax=Entelurus aequoreus TaxID=161455 RepID=UPI002B1DCA1D|nr:cell division cycle-associated protein 2 isoform X2 [Entelurus aequoreus]
MAKETDQKEKMLQPSQDDSAPVLRNSPAPLNFHTPSQFGISVQSFTPTSSGHTEKSRLAQLKARRRSNVGARGSPETNSLIRFIAQQRMKDSPKLRTPQHVRGSPNLPRIASTLTQKMASFQNLLNLEESEACDPMPRQNGSTGGCVMTRDNLSDVNDQEERKENHTPVMSPTPSKRRRVGCQVKIGEEHASYLYLSLRDKEDNRKAVKECSDDVTTEGLPSSETEATRPLLLSPLLHIEHKPPTFFTPHRQDNVVEFEIPRGSCDPTSDSTDESSSAFQISSLPPLLEMKPAGQENSSGTPAAKKNKRRVHFGGALSPEVYDRNLPPSTPLHKGGTPVRGPTPGGVLKLCSVLKTPQRNERHTPVDQPDLSSPIEFGASPVLAIPRKCIYIEEDGANESEKNLFPFIKDSDFAEISDAEFFCTTQLNLNNAFHEELLSTVETTESGTNPATHVNVLNETVSLSEEALPVAVSEAPSRLRNRKKKDVAKPKSIVELRASPRSRKRKLPEESKPVKRLTRSATQPSEKFKLATARRWKKEVNRSLYGCREYASKNPSLSPIAESFLNQFPAAQHTPIGRCEDGSPNLSTAGGPMKAEAQDASTFPMSISKRTTEKNRGTPGTGVEELELKRKVNVSDSDLLCVELEISENHKDEMATLPGVSIEVSSVPDQDGTEAHCALTAADTATAMAECPLTDDDHTIVEVGLTSQQAQIVSGSSVNPTEEQPDPGSSGPGQKDLAPWQADFNFEDVFKPVATRGQRSVRRSLRNQKSLAEDGDDAGLAWFPRVSPERRRESIRRSLRRRCVAGWRLNQSILSLSG